VRLLLLLFISLLYLTTKPTFFLKTIHILHSFLFSIFFSNQKVWAPILIHSPLSVAASKSGIKAPFLLSWIKVSFSPYVYAFQFLRLCNWGTSMLRVIFARWWLLEVREANHFLKFRIEICFDDSELHDWMLNWCLNYIIGCVIELCKNSRLLHVRTDWESGVFT